jgi:hypothetical protein
MKGHIFCFKRRETASSSREPYNYTQTLGSLVGMEVGQLPCTTFSDWPWLKSLMNHQLSAFKGTHMSHHSYRASNARKPNICTSICHVQPDRSDCECNTNKKMRYNFVTRQKLGSLVFIVFTDMKQNVSTRLRICIRNFLIIERGYATNEYLRKVYRHRIRQLGSSDWRIPSSPSN